MHVSFDWLNDFVDIKDIDPQKVADRLTMSTVEIEEVLVQGADLKHIVVGEVTAVHAHPNADKLKLCIVDTGKEKVQVVCGGSNVREGMKVVMGNIGATVRWHGGEEMVLKKTKIRGEESFGMICASDEIGLSDIFPKESDMEILDLSDSDAPIGMPLADALSFDDIILEVDNKSMTHRPDLWGHAGIARELSALLQKPFKQPKPAKVRERQDVTLTVDVRDPDLCPRYMATVMEGVKIGPSPGWMQKRLEAVGLRPKNNIVDITNYVMLELGQPMHAFDADTLNRKSDADHIASVVVRKAKKGERIETLYGGEYELSPEMLVIADADRSIAIAGVIGGDDSGVTEKTTRIVLESANFDPISVRKTAAKLGIRTDSSTRFEKSLDPNLAELGMKRAVELIRECCKDAQVVSRVADVSNFKLNLGPISISHEYIEQRLGLKIESKDVVVTLENLGFSVKDRRGEYMIDIPSWRATKDISIAEDIVEEVARMYGYAKIPAHLPDMNIAPPKKDVVLDLKRRTQHILAFECGFNEVLNYSFVSPDWLSRLGMDTDSHLELDNPVAKDRPYLRRTMLPNLLSNVESNAHRFDEVAIFEIGRTFIKERDGEVATQENSDRLPAQDTMLGMAYSKKGNEQPFFELSEALSALLDRLGVEYRLNQLAAEAPFVHPGRYAEIVVGGDRVGRVVEIHPQTQARLGIDERTSVLQLNLSSIVDYLRTASAYTPLAAYPSVERDIAFVVEAQTSHVKVKRALTEIDGLIESVELFDVYSGTHIDEGQKSMAYRIVYRSGEKTLEAADVDTIHEKVIKKLQKEFGAQVRK